MKPILNRSAILLLMLVLLTGGKKLYANAAQPGIWNAGGTIFTMLYPEDSLAFRKVQMQEERIYIQLYKGYAVVKGVYLFRNSTNMALNLKMGYPVNGIYHGGATDLNEVTLDSLSQFMLKINGNQVPLLKEMHPELNNDQKSPVPRSDNWMVWPMHFSPLETRTVEVYFIVNTNNAQVRKGYENERRNAFIYLLESGSVWKQPIEKGHFYVQLMDGLTPKNMNGMSGGFGFRYNKSHQLFAGEKAQFSPTPKDNLVVSYHAYDERFDFEKVIPNAGSLFTGIDELSLLPLHTYTYASIAMGDPYEVKTTFWGSLPALLTFAVIALPSLIGIGIILFIIHIIIQRRKRR